MAPSTCSLGSWTSFLYLAGFPTSWGVGRGKECAVYSFPLLHPQHNYTHSICNSAKRRNQKLNEFTPPTDLSHCCHVLNLTCQNKAFLLPVPRVVWIMKILTLHPLHMWMGVTALYNHLTQWHVTRAAMDNSSRLFDGLSSESRDSIEEGLKIILSLGGMCACTTSVIYYRETVSLPARGNTN